MKKILVKAPESRDECIHSFSFFHFLRENFVDAEIDVIVDEKNNSLFHYVKPLGMQVFSLPEAERGVLKLHRFAANLNTVFNVDVYFDLEGTKSSASLGKFFRAAQSYGYGDGLQKLLYSTVIEKRNCMSLLEAVVEKSFAERRIRGGVAKPVKEIIDLPPYFVLFLDDLEDEKVRDFWKYFINSFSGRYFVLWRSHDDKMITAFEEELDKKNNIRVLLDDDLENTEQFLINSTAVFSNMRWPMILSSYLALDSFYFTFADKKLIRVPHFYSAPTQIDIVDGKQAFVDGEQKDSLMEWLEQECKL